MDISPLYLSCHDLQPYYQFAVDGIDLTGTNFVCSMRNNITGQIKINRATVGCVITSATAGQAEYRWQVGDTDTAGVYSIEFEFTPITGGKFTVPGEGMVATVIITPDIDGV